MIVLAAELKFIVESLLHWTIWEDFSNNIANALKTELNNCKNIDLINKVAENYNIVFYNRDTQKAHITYKCAHHEGRIHQKTPILLQKSKLLDSEKCKNCFK